jgi:Rod binding domain-containing protein
MDIAITSPALTTELQRPGPALNEKAARAAAEEFEANFISQLLGFMFSGIKSDGPFGGGNSEKVYRSMQNDQYAREIARGGGVGIADDVMREIIRMQEGDANG